MLSLITFCLFVVYVSNGFNHTHLKRNKRNNNLKICHGDNADWNDFPYMVGLYMPEAAGGNCFCSGSILTKSNDNGVGVILTAAHCLDETVLGGGICVGCTHWEWDYNNPNNNDANAKMYKIYDFVNNPGWNPNGDWDYDIGLIYLSEPITDPSDNDKVVEVAICSSQPSMDDALRIQGYGETHTPQSPQLEVGSTNYIGPTNGPCNVIYGLSYDWIKPSMTCMTNRGYGSASQTDCYGDSGSPVMAISDSDDYNAIGIVSWGYSENRPGCCPTDYPSVITDLCYIPIQQWIDDNIDN